MNDLTNYQQWQQNKYGSVLIELPDFAPEDSETIRLSGTELQAEVISTQINFINE